MSGSMTLAIGGWEAGFGSPREPECGGSRWTLTVAERRPTLFWNWSHSALDPFMPSVPLPNAVAASSIWRSILSGPLPEAGEYVIMSFIRCSCRARREENLGDLIEIEEDNSHFIHSVLRERIVEHVFVGDAPRRLWQRGVMEVEVLRSEFDAGGDDLVMSYQKVVRHIRFKSIMEHGKAASVKVSLKLMEKPSGCVIWIVLDPKLELKSYRWFGGAPGKPLPDVSNFKVAKAAKANAEGTKLEKLQHRVVPRGKFEQLDTLDAVLTRLSAYE
jgi:hypothetical protein